ncbi:MAG TPA: RraA family protein [Galbitalea sp.]|nr:RraA family protein [Galbitalea sp.]
MDAQQLENRFARLSTAHIADGCVRVGVDVRCAPAALQGLARGMRLVGRALPAQHVGSVDVFLEAFEQAEPGDILVVDNGGRLEESCVGDLVTIEAKGAGLSGILIWGLRRDTVDILVIDLPVFSLGTIPTGPLSVATRPSGALATAKVGDWTITRDDVVFGDEDGILFVPADRVDEVVATAEIIRDTERSQAAKVAAGDTLRVQMKFADYLAARELDPELTFRDHLRAVGGAIEV